MNTTLDSAPGTGDTQGLSPPPDPRIFPVKLVREAYGTNARASAIADFVELACLATYELTENDLRDRLKDTGIVLPAVKYVLLEEALSDDVEEGGGDDDQSYADSARQVFALLEDRERLLGPRYPFEFQHQRFCLRSETEGESYLALLAMTVAHAHGIKTSADPKRVFEATVTRVLNARGWKAANVGRESKAQGGKSTFVETLRAVRATCELSGESDPQAVIKRAANDEGVDTLAHHSWSDDRPGRWTLIGQATLEKSDGWAKKVEEPKPSLWARLLGDAVLPQAFLAVPHHVEPIHLRKLVQDSTRLVLDRLRLARYDTGISADERDILNAVRAAKVEYR